MKRNRMKIKLTKEQKKHLKSLQWLFQGARASGRTTLLAYVLIDTVLKTGQTMRIIDHHPNRMADRFLADIIVRIICEESLPLTVNNTTMTLTPLIS